MHISFLGIRYAKDILDNKEKYQVSVEQDPSMHWFTQRLDHFDRQVTKTWQQRSFQNDTFFDGTGPVFLCVGGEGPPLDASVLIASVHCNDMVELAPQVGALMLAVEHRYYGDSMPTGRELSTKKLRYLSSQQALGDLAEFHSQVMIMSLPHSSWFILFNLFYHSTRQFSQHTCLFLTSLSVCVCVCVCVFCLPTTPHFRS
jgi:hypothetical protein